MIIFLCIVYHHKASAIVIAKSWRFKFQFPSEINKVI